jgi:plasmid stabilization system protein ParE
MKITWTPKALQSYFGIFNFLTQRCTKKEVETFIDQTDRIIEQISENPYMFVATDKRRNVRKGYVNELVSMFYKVYPRKEEIELLRFWDIRQDPTKQEY